jgi:hypothetical protein
LYQLRSNDISPPVGPRRSAGSAIARLSVRPRAHPPGSASFHARTGCAASGDGPFPNSAIRRGSLRVVQLSSWPARCARRSLAEGLGAVRTCSRAEAGAFSGRARHARLVGRASRGASRAAVGGVDEEIRGVSNFTRTPTARRQGRLGAALRPRSLGETLALTPKRRSAEARVVEANRAARGGGQ